MPPTGESMTGTLQCRVVHRVSPSVSKRRGGSVGSAQQQQHQQRKRSKPNDEPDFPKLDPSDPANSRRIQQRRKAVAKGKNTAGYDAYRHRVPKENRRLRTMETPSTPDPTLDIPNKRWQGMIRAWRIALHKYDPPDLIQTSLDEGSSKVSSLADSVDSHSAHTIQDMLSPIDVVMTTPPPVARMRHGDSPKPSVVRRMTFDSPYGNGGSPISVLSASSGRHCLDDRSDDEEDSDDDLL